MNLHQYLSHDEREPIPAWLGAVNRDCPVDLAKGFFQSRVVFYPGSRHDGNVVRLFGGTHSAHCFIHCDYGLPREALIRALEGRGEHEWESPFRGYTTLRRVELKPSDLTPGGWRPSLPEPLPPPGDDRWLPLIGRRLAADDHPFRPISGPFGFLEILERDPSLGEDHGAHRLAILFLGADAYATYDALYSRGNAGYSPPYCLVLQDRRFGFGGGNYDRFGWGGWLEKVAMASAAHPEYLLVEQGTQPWALYEKVMDSGHGYFRLYRHGLFRGESP